MLNCDSIDPFIVEAEVCRRVPMGSEAIAVDRTDAVQRHLEHYFDNPSCANFSRDITRRKNYGPAPRHWRGPFRPRRLLGWTIRMPSVFARSLVRGGMRVDVGYAEVTRPRV